MREVVWAAYLPGHHRYEQAECERLKERMMQRESELPVELKLQEANERGTMYFAGIINITYKYVC